LFITEFATVSDTCWDMGDVYNPTSVEASNGFDSETCRVGDLKPLQVSAS